MPRFLLWLLQKWTCSCQRNARSQAVEKTMSMFKMHCHRLRRDSRSIFNLGSNVVGSKEAVLATRLFVKQLPALTRRTVDSQFVSADTNPERSFPVHVRHLFRTV